MKSHDSNSNQGVKSDSTAVNDQPLPSLKDKAKPENPEKEAYNYKKLDFFYRRTAFRTMTEYYKGLFKPHLE